jgi:hypothetical protein
MRTLFTLGLLFCSGCALLANKADYADYREVRLASNLQTRAVAMQRYVEKHPNGQWRQEIQAARASQDLAAFEAGKDTRSGLEHYLRAFPDGAFVAQARGRLSAVALIEQRNQVARHQAEQFAEARKQRTDELRRTWVGRFIAYWTSTLTGMRGWGEPIANVAQANPQFSRAFAAQPRPRCTQDECLKYYTSQYAVPVPGGNRIERTLSLVMRLRLRAGKLERAELLLPESGFSRWYELENRRAIADGDPEGRAAAAAWAVERLLPIIAAVGTGLTPTRDERPPTIDRPAIGSTGELTDTSIEAPSDPQNRVSGQPDNAGIGTQVTPNAQPAVGELVQPPDAASPDMVFAPVGVGKQGQRVTLAPTAPKRPAAADGGGGPGAQAPDEVMVMDPVAIPKAQDSRVTAVAPAPAPSGVTAATAPVAASQPSAKSDAARAGWVRGFQWQGLHIVAFAAGGDAGAASYDGVIIERSSGPSAAARGKAGAGKAPPRAH